MCRKVYHLRNATIVVAVFPFKSEWQVRCTRINTSTQNSKPITRSNETYTDKCDAVIAFNEITAICASERKQYLRLH